MLLGGGPTFTDDGGGVGASSSLCCCGGEAAEAVAPGERLKSRVPTGSDATAAGAFSGEPHLTPANPSAGLVKLVKLVKVLRGRRRSVRSSRPASSPRRSAERDSASEGWQNPRLCADAVRAGAAREVRSPAAPDSETAVAGGARLLSPSKESEVLAPSLFSPILPQVTSPSPLEGDDGEIEGEKEEEEKDEEEEEGEEEEDEAKDKKATSTVSTAGPAPSLCSVLEAM
jgi:hypothetical protein